METGKVYPLLAREGGMPFSDEFSEKWDRTVNEVVVNHPLWQDSFAKTLAEPYKDPKLAWRLVRTWAEQMWHGSMAFPNYVGNLMGRVKPHAAGRKLATNAAAERGYPDESRSHYLLNVDLLRTIGLTPKEISSLQILPESKAYIEGHLHATREGDLVEAIGLLGLGIEALTTHEFSLVGSAFNALAKKEGAILDPVEATLAQGYFYENVAADQQHASEFMEIAWILFNTPPKDREYLLEGRNGKPKTESIHAYIAKLRAGAQRSLGLRRNFFQGVYSATA